MKKSLIVVAFLAIFASTVKANVLTTIKPLGFIANAIADGVTETEVLLPTSASPHDYSLKPSDIEKLNKAELVIWVGEGLETFLEKSIEKRPKSKVLTLADVPEIAKKVSSEEGSGGDEDHHHEHRQEHRHDHSKDWHIWLSSEISQLAAEQIATHLEQQYPAKKAKIADNLAEFKMALADKKTALKKQLDPVKTQGYYSFHKAYGYFEAEYGLNPLGAFTLNPTVAPGAKTLAKIKQNITANQASCLFAEPQFTPKVIETLSKATSVKVGRLDPLGESVEMSKTAYLHFLQSLADSFSQCLAQK